MAVIANVHLHFEGQAAEVCMLADEMTSFPGQAFAAIQQRAEELLRGRPLLRLVYTDDDGDRCTLTCGTMDDALSFAVLCDEGLCELHLAVLAEEGPAPAPELAMEPSVPEPAAAEVAAKAAEEGKEEPPAAPAEPPAEVPVSGEEAVSEAAEEDEEKPPVAPAKPPVEVHVGIGCDPKDTKVPDLSSLHTGVAVEALVQACTPNLRLDSLILASPKQHETKKAAAAPAPKLQGLAAGAAAAFRALALGLEDELCLEALMALLTHPDERLRTSAMAAVEAATAAATAAADEAAAEPAEPLAAELEEPALAPAEAEAALAEAAPVELEDVVAEVEEEPKPGACSEVEEAPKVEARPAAAEAEEAAAEPEAAAAAVAPTSPAACLSAKALGSSPLVLGVEATEDGAARGDATEEFSAALAQVGAAQAYRCGRIVVPVSEEGISVPAEAKVIMINDGNAPWPEACYLSVVAGDPFGLANLGLGPMQPGEAAEVVLDLRVPLRPEPGVMRSAWSLIDAQTGSSFGPLIFFEVVWATF